MSLSRLASVEAARAVPPAFRAAALAPVPGAPAAPAAPADDRFDLLTKYIPTETITLYVAAMALKDAWAEVWPGFDPWVLYGVFAVLTPALLVFITYVKQRGAERAAGAPKAAFRPHPWPIIAALIAFLAWGLSVPGLEMSDKVIPLAAFAALSVSTVLSLFDGLFGP